jgi:hypothetical protein
VTNLIQKFADAGIFTSTKNAAGEGQRTTGRGPTSLAFYATSKIGSWKSKDGLRGGSKVLAILNRQTTTTDPETGEIVVEQTREFIDVLFDREIALSTGDQVLAIGRWQPGQPFVNREGVPSKWNDSFFATEFVVVPKNRPVVTVSESVTIQAETTEDELMLAFDTVTPPVATTPRKRK